jgi:hypothetical protein
LSDLIPVAQSPLLQLADPLSAGSLAQHVEIGHSHRENPAFDDSARQ